MDETKDGCKVTGWKTTPALLSVQCVAVSTNKGNNYIRVLLRGNTFAPTDIYGYEMLVSRVESRSCVHSGTLTVPQTLQEEQVPWHDPWSVSFAPDTQETWNPRILSYDVYECMCQSTVRTPGSLFYPCTHNARKKQKSKMITVHIRRWRGTHAGTGGGNEVKLLGIPLDNFGPSSNGTKYVCTFSTY